MKTSSKDGNLFDFVHFNYRKSLFILTLLWRHHPLYMYLYFHLYLYSFWCNRIIFSYLLIQYFFFILLLPLYSYKALQIVCFHVKEPVGYFILCLNHLYLCTINLFELNHLITHLKKK